MTRGLAIAALTFATTASALAEELPPGRTYMAQAIGMCLDLHEQPGAQMTAPAPFALNPQGYLLAEDRGVLVAVRGSRGLDPDEEPDLADVVVECEALLQGEASWFADFAATQVADLKSLGWSLAEHRSGLVDGTQTFTLVGRGTLTIQYGVGRPNALFRLGWRE